MCDLTPTGAEGGKIQGVGLVVFIKASPPPFPNSSNALGPTRTSGQALEPPCPEGLFPFIRRLHTGAEGSGSNRDAGAVSYTHLTLPTKA